MTTKQPYFCVRGSDDRTSLHASAIYWLGEAEDFSPVSWMIDGYLWEKGRFRPATEDDVRRHPSAPDYGPPLHLAPAGAKAIRYAIELSAPERDALIAAVQRLAAPLDAHRAINRDHLLSALGKLRR